MGLAVSGAAQLWPLFGGAGRCAVGGLELVGGVVDAVGVISQPVDEGRAGLGDRVRRR